MGLLLSIIKILPSIIQLVTALEIALPQSGVGAAKLEIANQVLDIVYDESKDIGPATSKERWLAILLEIIGGIVGVFNKAGIFKKA